MLLLCDVFSVSVMLEHMKQSWAWRTFTLRIMQAHVYTQGDPICVFICCRDKEEQLVRLRDSQRLQAQQAESALEKFKKQVELSSEKTYADMKQQVSQGQLQFTLCHKVYESDALSSSRYSGHSISLSPRLLTDPLRHILTEIQITCFWLLCRLQKSHVYKFPGC